MAPLWSVLQGEGEGGGWMRSSSRLRSGILADQQLLEEVTESTGGSNSDSLRHEESGHEGQRHLYHAVVPMKHAYKQALGMRPECVTVTAEKVSHRAKPCIRPLIACSLKDGFLQLSCKCGNPF